MEIQSRVKEIAGIAVLILGVVIVFGNLSGNLGFTDLTDAGYNESQEVITDVMTGTTNLTGQFGAVFTILGALLIIGAVVWILKLFGLGGGKKGMFG